MTAGASRSAHLATVNALTQRNHLSCRTFRNGKCSRTGVWMRALWRFRGLLNGTAGRSSRARTCLDLRSGALGVAVISDPVDPAAYIVGNVERTVRSHRQNAE